MQQRASIPAIAESARVFQTPGKFYCVAVGFLVLSLSVALDVVVVVVHAETAQNDAKILKAFADGLENPELLKWPAAGSADPCGPPSWPHVFCSNGRVTQIQVQGLGLKGPLPPDLNRLDKLYNVGLQNNKFTGALPTFSGLSDLQFAYLDFNEFDIIPANFFAGLSSVRVLALDSNPFNKSAGWSLPDDLAQCAQLVNFSCSSCNLVGAVPAFFGTLPSLGSLRLSYNKLTGSIPATFRGSMLQILWLNDQDGDKMTGPIDAISSMAGLTQVWLHGNRFSGTIPEDIGRLTSLRELNLNGNQLVGMIPISLASMDLRLLDLSNNMFMGSIPKFRAANVSYNSNSFCRDKPGLQCAPQVIALLEFLHGLGYPERLASQWTGNDPCGGPWWGITCNVRNEVSIVNLQRVGLNGTVSPWLANLSSLVEVHLEGNNLHGVVPGNLTQLRLLRLLNLSGNDFDPPLPRFRRDVKVVTDGNAKLQDKPTPTPTPTRSPLHPTGRPNLPSNNPSSGKSRKPSPDGTSSRKSPYAATNRENSTNPKVVYIAAVAGGCAVLVLLLLLLGLYCLRTRAKKRSKSPPSSVVIYPKDSSDPSNILKYAVADGVEFDDRSTTNMSGSNIHMIDSGNLLISVQVLRKVTKDFAQENELGRGGFGVVYKGELEDGAKLAVKRMVVGTVTNKALDEFQSEIAVLSKVRHRNLVSLLGYAVEGNERLLVYEYMPQGALSRHLFHWRSHGLEPLSWTRRINVALDVARGVEYLHSLAHQSFIHRDLKSANILLDEDFRAKVSDFGLVKLAPDRERSVATRLAGTFGYLAPEYAVTGKITTKVDVFSFGVVLMELLTGLVALDEQRPEEKRYLAEWFWQIKSNGESLIASIDPALAATEENYETIQTIATLAGHCTARDPNHRPEMGHAVNVLGQLVEKWRPCEESEEFSGIDLTLPLPEMLKGWQEEGSREMSGASQDSKGSIPAKPAGFADSFTSADAR
ncbi:receptor-like kinase TMK3 [Andrographis paniculata]|uniref:receptor-like kinase TMK3 n=1 Tax=Andrographis paniculata TaxID=175694 RepID=UPI0021E97F54|nr:receptor-like kinase TMK3 [Andrographis paniculata]